MLLTNRLKHYSIRRLSPFRGTLHILETRDAQAYTENGRNWRLQIRTLLPRQSWGSLDQSLSKRVVMVGEWATNTGLRQMPLNPLLDRREIEGNISELLLGVEKYHDQLPFPSEDHFELWLLDAKQQWPLALLASSRDEDQLNLSATMRWRAAEITDNSFVSAALLAANRPQQQKQLHHYDVMNSLVRKLAGTTGRAQWFNRTPDRSGIGLNGQHIAKKLEGRLLPAEAFPELLVHEAGDSELNTAIVADYISWLAPRLLTLLTLQPATRNRLEILAFKQALEVEKYYRLYPEVFDESGLTTALVEAQLRRSSGDPEQR